MGCRFSRSGVTYLYVLDIFPKYTWMKPLKGKKAKTVLHGFVEIVNESYCQPNKLWVDEGREFCNNPMPK